MKISITLIIALFATHAAAKSSDLRARIKSLNNPMEFAQGTAGGGGGMGLIAGDNLRMRVNYLGQFGQLDILETDAKSLEKLNAIEDPRITLRMQTLTLSGQVLESSNPNQVSITTDDGNHIIVVNSSATDEGNKDFVDPISDN